MKAILMTRCRCEREIDVTYPPPPSILVALNLNTPMTVRAFTSRSVQDPVTPLQSRRFELDRPVRSPQDIAQYTEVLHGG